MTQKTSIKNIVQNGTELSFEANAERHVFHRVELPDAFMEWVIAGRESMYDVLEGKGTAPFFEAHLPVVVTYSRNEPIPFNTGNKGVGLLPQEETLEQYCELLDETLNRTRDLPTKTSLPERLHAARTMVERRDVSNRALVTLEIFEKQTFQNLCDFPVATLHYTDRGPHYRSFQIDSVVEVLTGEHPVHRFALLSRQLFEQDAFHITQTKFPYAYRFHPVKIRDKTPHRRRD